MSSMYEEGEKVSQRKFLEKTKTQKGHPQGWPLCVFVLSEKHRRETFSPSSYRLDIHMIPGYCQLSGCLNV